MLFPWNYHCSRRSMVTRFKNASRFRKIIICIAILITSMMSSRHKAIVISHHPICLGFLNIASCYTIDCRNFVPIEFYYGCSILRISTLVSLMLTTHNKTIPRCVKSCTRGFLEARTPLHILNFYFSMHLHATFIVCSYCAVFIRSLSILVAIMVSSCHNCVRRTKEIAVFFLEGACSRPLVWTQINHFVHKIQRLKLILNQSTHWKRAKELTIYVLTPQI